MQTNGCILHMPFMDLHVVLYRRTGSSHHHHHDNNNRAMVAWHHWEDAAAASSAGSESHPFETRIPKETWWLTHWHDSISMKQVSHKGMGHMSEEDLLLVHWRLEMFGSVSLLHLVSYFDPSPFPGMKWLLIHDVIHLPERWCSFWALVAYLKTGIWTRFLPFEIH